jgi:DNA-binding protein HU-beta
LEERKNGKKAKATDKALTKAKIIECLAEETGLAKKDVSKALTALTDLAYAQAAVGFTVPGIGKLVVVQRKARMGRNPATGASIKIPAKKVLKFRLAKAAKDAIAPAKK